ncbi:hypothetical protein A4G28_01830 [Mycobacterium ostraviense]|uniref:Uncharacterized protein n=1 Tax=Mycobacterium ostraviense TaxID=2738409 RepID=A0A163UDN5_9MYCO|nr:hypothetical protein A4G28_01830 [Mycobacterium ostraviense]
MPATLRQAAGCGASHGAATQRPLAAWRVQLPALARGSSGAQLHSVAWIRPSSGSNWSKPNRLTPQSVIACTFDGVSACGFAGGRVGLVRADTNVESS